MVLLVKVVTCGNVPLESSFQKVPRCVYTSTSLYEYRGWDSKAANPTHRRFTWGLRSSEVSFFSCFFVFSIYNGCACLLVNVMFCFRTFFSFFSSSLGMELTTGPIVYLYFFTCGIFGKIAAASTNLLEVLLDVLKIL